MVNIPLFKAAKTNSELISTAEAFNVWNVLRSRYMSIETYQTFINLIHDRDFTALLYLHLNNFNTQIKILENRGADFKIKLPPKSPN